MTLQDLVTRFQSASESLGCVPTVNSKEGFNLLRRSRGEREERIRLERLTAMGERAMELAREIRNPLVSIELFVSMLEDLLRWTTECAVVGSLSSVREIHHAGAGTDAGPTSTRRDSSVSSADRRAKTLRIVTDYDEDCSAVADQELLQGCF